MRVFRIMLALALVLGLSACASKFRAYDGPAVTLVQVQKANRKLYLMNNDTVLRSFDIGLGFAPVGPKQFENDGKTPEGTYVIDRRNPNSRYYLSIGISYPTPEQVAYASSMGKRPGGDIFIHGNQNKGDKRGDWTWGCIAVTDREMEDIYAMVPDGTVIQILP